MEKEFKIDLTFAHMANKKAELIARENAAREYSANCKRNRKFIDMEDVLCFFTCVSIFGSLLMLYIMGAMIV